MNIAYLQYCTAVLMCLVAGITWAAEKPELFAPGVVSTQFQETSATFTPAGDTVYFMRSDMNESDDTILLSQRTASGWSTPEVASFSGVWHDSEPFITPDGNKLFFVSNRPIKSGDKPLLIEKDGFHFAGKNLWYVEKSAHGWSEPIHVEGAVNQTMSIYNPSVAQNGNLYFSSHREDSGKAYQIYLARWNGKSYDAPERLNLGSGIEHNRMDPSIDPQERFLLYAGNEGDSLGSADIYIVFREKDGSWGKPVHLGDGVNSDQLENAPVLGRRFGELYVASQRAIDVQFPKPRDDYASLMKRLGGTLNGSRNIWRCDISDVLRAHGIQS
jgi:hypothetical protein